MSASIRRPPPANPLTSQMGQKRWKDSPWGGRKRTQSENNWVGGAGLRPRSGRHPPGSGAGLGPPPASEASFSTEYSLERPGTRDTAITLLRERSNASSNMDCSNYQEKLHSWSAFFNDSSSAVVAPRPGTSLNSTRPRGYEAEMSHNASILAAQHAQAAASFPAKPRELFDPLDGLMPSAKIVSQRKYFVLPGIGGPGGLRGPGHPGDLFLRRQRSNMETLNQLDYARDNYEDDAEFFAELIELKKESSQGNTPMRQRSPVNPLPPIAKLRDQIRPGTHIAEVDEKLFLSSRGSPSGMSDISDVEDFRAITPEPDYADTSPRKHSDSSLMLTARSRRLSSVSRTSDMIVGAESTPDDRLVPPV